MDNDRIEKLETITKRLMRRASKHTNALITPYPISSATFGADIEGPILRYMFPCDGVVSKGLIRVSPKPKVGIGIEAKIFNGIRSISKGFTMDKVLLVIEPNLTVVAGDCLELSLISEEAQATVEVWVSFLWKPSIKNVEVKSFLIEELENDISKKEALLLTPPELPVGGEG